MNLEKKLDFWIKNNYNVLFKGKAGCGKSSMIIEAFNKAKLNWLYFSASTMDPFTDFVGVPKEAKDANGNSYLDLVRPKQFQNDEIDAIVFDEFNRGTKKTINAVMELLQFKSINGKKFNRLKIIWAAINPDDDPDAKYAVEALDPAHIDRFHVIVDVPYAPHAIYFKDKYGEDLAGPAITWWREMPTELKNVISPRRLDYALDIYTKGGDMHDVLPPKANVNKLIVEIQTGSITKKLKKLFIEKNDVEAKKFLNSENNFSACSDLISTNTEYAKFFVPLLAEEKVASLMSKFTIVEDVITRNFVKYESLIRSVAAAKSNKKLSDRLNNVISRYDFQKTIVNSGDNSKVSVFFNENSNEQNFKANLDLIKYDSTTQERIRNYHIILDSISKEMSAEVAAAALQRLVGIVRHSHLNTIKSQLKNIIPMINHLIIVLATHGSLPTFSDTEMRDLKSFSDFIFNCKIDNKQLTPQTKNKNSSNGDLPDWF